MPEDEILYEEDAAMEEDIMIEVEDKREKAVAIARLVAMIFAMVNSFLTAKGINPIPLDENMIIELATHAIDASLIVWAGWKDNNVTKKARKRKAAAKAIEDGRVMIIKKEGELNG